MWWQIRKDWHIRKCLYSFTATKTWQIYKLDHRKLPQEGTAYRGITDVRTSETQILDTSWEISGEEGTKKLYHMSLPWRWTIQNAIDATATRQTCFRIYFIYIYRYRLFLAFVYEEQIRDSEGLGVLIHMLGNKSNPSRTNTKSINWTVPVRV